MNGEYIITPWNVYHTERKKWDRFLIDNQNKIHYKNWKVLEWFDNIKYRTDFSKTLSDFFNEIWDLIYEKWNLAIFKNRHWEKIYIYNSYERLEKLENEIIYSNILFEDRQNMIQKKIEDYCNYVLANNIGTIAKTVSLETLKTKKDFIINIWNSNYLNKKINITDNKLEEDIYLLSKGCFFWHYGKLYLYAFKENNGQFIPIFFNDNSTDVYDISETLSIDKLEVIMMLESKNKCWLFFEKILNENMVFKPDMVDDNIIQSFYDWLFRINKKLTLKEMK